VQAAALEKELSMLTTVHTEAKRDAQARLDQAEARLVDAERAMAQLRDQEEAGQRTLDGESRQRVAMAEKVAAAQKEAQQAIGEAEHQSKLREQASAEVSQLQAALSDVQGALSTRTEQLQSLESRRQRELQQEAEQTAKAQAAAQSAAARSDWLQEQVSALKAERTTLDGKLESAFNAQREARSQVGSCDRPRHSRRAEAGCTYGKKPSGRVHRQRWAG
jgi:chromosome segregation ATPase